MPERPGTRLIAIAALTAAGVFECLASPPGPQGSIDPRSLPRVGTIDERFQSYNIEMVEVTGGRFWRPYDSAAKAETSSGNQPGNQPAGMSASLYEYRQPIDLSSVRLRKMAAALSPAYVRVSGTWANTTWFHDSDDPTPAA